MTPKINFSTKKIDKLNLIEIKNTCSAKDIVKRIKGQAIDWEKIFANHIAKDLYPESIKNSQ